MGWDENANICTASLIDDSRQPLTRGECAGARSTWNENANVCEWESSSSAEANLVATLPERGSILVSIDKSKQRMTVLVDGVQRYHWPVSTGARGYSTPSGTYTASSMNEIWYSKQWDNAPMPHAVFFTKEGHAIHGTNEVRRLGKPASHGCVRLSPQNAATLYALVDENGLENTRVVLVGLTPGGEGKVARQRAGKVDQCGAIQTSLPNGAILRAPAARRLLWAAVEASVARQFNRLPFHPHDGTMSASGTKRTCQRTRHVCF